MICCHHQYVLNNESLFFVCCVKTNRSLKSVDDNSYLHSKLLSVHIHTHYYICNRQTFTPAGVVYCTWESEVHSPRVLGEVACRHSNGDRGHGDSDCPSVDLCDLS